MLTKRKQFTLILLALLVFPAAALAAGGGGSSPEPKLGDAEAVPMSPLQRPVDRFQRLVHRIAHEIDIRERAEEREAEREREEEFADLPGGVSASTLEAIASCESGGDPSAVSSDGTYRGLYQFDYGTWESVGGSGDPAAASAAEQTYRAALLYTRSGSSPWPVCG
ncbi:MAG TPA: transglycosylase family protein [Solirubrobacterales bacterium]|nr:transglycosylase family protein [Solirubrobacterales bacterium]